MIQTVTSTGQTRWKFCPSCATKIDDAWKFCAECGTQVGHIAAPWVVQTMPFIYPTITHPWPEYPTPSVPLWSGGPISSGGTYTVRGDEQIAYTSSSGSSRA